MTERGSLHHSWYYRCSCGIHFHSRHEDEVKEEFNWHLMGRLPEYKAQHKLERIDQDLSP